MADLDGADHALLNRLQEGLPLVPFPFAALAGDLGISEEEAISRVRRLKERGIIRRVGGIFDAFRLGFVSTLVAVEVEPERLEKVAGQVSLYPEVTHNYARDHRFNLWFTLTAPDEGRIAEVVEGVKRIKGVRHLLDFPALRRFKVEVRMKFGGDSGADSQTAEDR